MGLAMIFASSLGGGEPEDSEDYYEVHQEFPVELGQS